jgi:acyl-CoA synthetase (AMP-forming)/AMP-acid ligase II/thioesterase domain-containing protein/aryl carrier-like protein
VTVAALIDRLARERPSATFLIDPEAGRETTFADLRVQTAAIAARLRQLGLQQGDRVCVMMDNGRAAVASQLGVMSGGFVAVLLDPGAGPAQLADIAGHCDARAILVGDEHHAQLETVAAELGQRIACVHVDAGLLAAAAFDPGTRTSDLLRPDDDAVLMYTSGSTGRPKGVLLSHANLVARLVASARAHELTPDDRLLCVLPLYHMSALVIMLGVLHSGGSIVLPPRFSVSRYWNWASNYRCTWLGMVPTIVTQLLHWGETHPGPPPETVRHVRFARSSSAPLNEVDHRAFERRFEILLVQGMGMTEAGGVFLNPPHREERKVGSLGRAYGIEVKVADADGHELGCGQIGELLVRGAGVMRGYYKDREATASTIDASGWLRSGDLVYRDEDGFFFHAGRVKELIIKAGTNVAPREVDEALASHPDVAQAAAVGIPDPTLGEDIAAFVVLRHGARGDERVLLDHCAARLGEFKTPSWIRFVDALPKGPTGKVQRAQLAQRLAATSGFGDGSHSRRAVEPFELVAPRTTLERTVAAVWTEVLGTEPASREDNFFDLGGTSLLAMRVTARLRRALGVHLSLGSLLAAPTIAAQAALIAEWEERRAADALAVDRVRDEDTAWATLLAPIDEGHVGVPLFCVYDIARFRKLAELLGPQQPVYGVAIAAAINAIDDAQPSSRFASLSIERLAHACVSEIRRIQPHGPYRIAGFSFGGRVALEVAQQLRAAGAHVQYLIALDTFMPGAFPRRPLRWLALHIGGLLRGGPRYLARAARGRRGQPDDAVLAPDAPDASSLARREARFRRQLGTRYRPRPLVSDIIVFRATQNEVAPQRRVDPQLGWSRIARGQLVVCDVPASHLEILDDRNSQIVAAALRPHLTRDTRP